MASRSVVAVVLILVVVGAILLYGHGQSNQLALVALSPSPTTFKVGWIIADTPCVPVTQEQIGRMNLVKSSFTSRVSSATGNLASIDASHPLRVVHLVDCNDHSIQEISKQFYQDGGTGDIFEFLFIAATSTLMPTAGHQTVRTNVLSGIGPGGTSIADNGIFFGSPSELLGVTWFGNHLQSAPAEVTDSWIVGETWVALHEFGHQWLAYARYSKGGAIVETGPNGLAEGVHWNAYTNTGDNTYGGSPMGGRNWIDNGDGTFTANPSEWPSYGADKFSKLDLYLMGLIPSCQVPPTFIIRNPTTVSWNPASGVWIVHGNKEIVTIDQIIETEGFRNPSLPCTIPPPAPQTTMTMISTTTPYVYYTTGTYVYYTTVVSQYGQTIITSTVTVATTTKLTTRVHESCLAMQARGGCGTCQDEQGRIVSYECPLAPIELFKERLLDFWRMIYCFFFPNRCIITPPMVP